MTTYDPITLEIIQNALHATSEEMFAAMQKTAMSSIIYEVLDMGTGVTDADGRLASSGAGVPAFVGVLDKSIKAIINKFSEPGQIGPGDVFVTNDPYHGGVTHLNDIVVATPVFAGETLIAWTANIAHNSDVGGMAPGSLTGDATEIYQEGLRLPAIKMIAGGDPISSVFDILYSNSRMPTTLEGDVWAAIAACRVGGRRLVEVANKYGLDVFSEAMVRNMDHGEALARKALKDLPKGTWEISEEQDDGAVLHVAITITDDEFLVDLRNNPEQNDNPNNSSRDAATVAAQMIFKSLTAPNSSASEGSFRPITLLTTPGTIFDALEPAPHGFYYELELRAYDLMWRCLAPVVPTHFGAGHFASVCGTFVGGTHPDTGRQYTIIEPQLGGWGATHERDGNHAMFSGFHGETYNCPAEINEIRNGLYIERMELNTEPGGEGERTGGRGIVMEYRVRSNDGYLTMDYTRSKFPAWGTEGGKDGSPNYCEVIRAEDGSVTRYSSVSGLETQEGDIIRIVTGNGGGHGDPTKRDPELVRADVKDELISPERAKSVFGVST